MYTKGPKVHWRDWKVGEVYFLENGHSPFIIKNMPPCAPWSRRDECNVVQEYLSGATGTTTKTYLCKAIEEGENDMTKLYEIKQEGKETLYGTKLAKNSAGQWVMEVKGTGQVITADPNQVEEVLPYTIGVNFESKGQTYHYTSEAGVAEVGDLFVVDAPSGRAIVQVSGVDTKSKSATKEFKPLGKLLLDK